MPQTIPCTLCVCFRIRTTQNVIEGVVVTFVDISDRKHVEMALEETQRRYQGIGELFTGVWNWTPDGRMTYVSRSFLDMLDLTEKDCEGHRWIKYDAERSESATRGWEELH